MLSRHRITEFTGAKEVTYNHIPEVHGLIDTETKSIGRVPGKALYTTGLSSSIWSLHQLTFRNGSVRFHHQGGNYLYEKYLKPFSGLIYPYPSFQHWPLTPQTHDYVWPMDGVDPESVSDGKGGQDDPVDDYTPGNPGSPRTPKHQVTLKWTTPETVMTPKNMMGVFTYLEGFGSTPPYHMMQAEVLTVQKFWGITINGELKVGDTSIMTAALVGTSTTKLGILADGRPNYPGFATTDVIYRHTLDYRVSLSTPNPWDAGKKGANYQCAFGFFVASQRAGAGTTLNNSGFVSEVSIVPEANRHSADQVYAILVGDLMQYAADKVPPKYADLQVISDIPLLMGYDDWYDVLVYVWSNYFNAVVPFVLAQDVVLQITGAVGSEFDPAYQSGLGRAVIPKSDFYNFGSMHLNVRFLTGTQFTEGCSLATTSAFGVVSQAFSVVENSQVSLSVPDGYTGEDCTLDIACSKLPLNEASITTRMGMPDFVSSGYISYVKSPTTIVVGVGVMLSEVIDNPPTDPTQANIIARSYRLIYDGPTSGTVTGTFTISPHGIPLTVTDPATYTREAYSLQYVGTPASALTDTYVLTPITVVVWAIFANPAHSRPYWNYDRNIHRLDRIIEVGNPAGMGYITGDLTCVTGSRWHSSGWYIRAQSYPFVTPTIDNNFGSYQTIPDDGD